MTQFGDRFAGAARAKLLEKFGQTVTYTANGVAGVSITAIWTAEQVAGSDYDDGIQETGRGEIKCSTADVTAPDRRDTFTIGGVVYRIARAEERWAVIEAGLVVFQLVDRDREEVSGPGHRIRR